MFFTVHGPVGALLGALTGEPVSAFLLGVGSHALLDVIPHGDERLFRGLERHAYIRAVLRILIIDVSILAVVLFGMFYSNRVWPSIAMIAGIAGSILPDIVSGFVLLFPNVSVLQWSFRVHGYFHERVIRYDPPLSVGFVIQAFVLTVIVFVFSRLIFGA